MFRSIQSLTSLLKPSFLLRTFLSLAMAYVLVPHIKPLVDHVLRAEGVLLAPSFLLFASVLYAAMGTTPDALWSVDPVMGLFLGEGLPHFSVAAMQRVSWTAKACHFVPRIRPAYGKTNFWIPSESVSPFARQEALRKTLTTLSPVVQEPPEINIDRNLWRLDPTGLLVPTYSAPVLEPSTDTIASPSAHDFLLFAALHYHAFWEWEVQVEWKGELAFTTKGTGPRALFDVDSEGMALPIVVAQLVRRPHAQSPLRAVALHTSNHEYGPYHISLDSLSRTDPACSIDFHSYAAESSKISASLNDLASAYYRVIRYIKHSAPPAAGHAVHIQVGQTLWIAILGGAVLDHGRLTIQNLPMTWSMKNTTSDEAYLSRIETILQLVEPYAKKKSFFDLVYSNGTSRRPALLFFFAGLFLQMALCFLLSVFTHSGVWLSVAMVNTIMTGKLSDWHSRYWGKTQATEQPGMKMYLPGTKDLMAVATFDRTSPRDGPLRAGLLLNVLGWAAAFSGAVFKSRTRMVLGMASLPPLSPKIIHSSMLLSVGLSVLICVVLFLQQLKEKTWADGSEIPTRWMAYYTVSCSLIVTSLGYFFISARVVWPLWLVLDILIWISGAPLGVLENGYILSADEGVLQMVLVNRWLIGVVVSTVAGNQAI